MISRILLDIDDVCNKMTIPMLQFMGCDINGYSQFPSHVGYDIVGAANHLVGEERWTPRTFWESIPRHIWSDAPLSDEFPQLIEHCERLVGRENICLLTSPTLDPECLAGKLEWIHKHMPPWLHRQFLVGPVKHFCARPDALLVDDADKNVRKFKEHGGQAFLVPRPWNSAWKNLTRNSPSSPPILYEDGDNKTRVPPTSRDL